MGQSSGCLCRSGKKWAGETLRTGRAVDILPKSWSLSLKGMMFHYRVLKSAGSCFTTFLRASFPQVLGRHSQPIHKVKKNLNLENKAKKDNIFFQHHTRALLYKSPEHFLIIGECTFL